MTTTKRLGMTCNKEPMPKAGNTLRVLVVDDDRDGADTLGLLVEELGNQVHVTYGGASALAIATVFRPDLMLIDLAMPDMDGCRLVSQFRRTPAFAQTRIVAVTGHTDEGHKTMAIKAGFDRILFKPVALSEIRDVLASVVHPAALVGQSPPRSNRRVESPAAQRLPISEVRKLRKNRKSQMLSQAESEAAICDGILRFREEYLGWGVTEVRVYLIDDLLVIRLLGGLAVAEQHLAKSLSPKKGRDLVKLMREQLLELARPMLESMVHEVIGVKVLTMHHDVSTATGEEVIVFGLTEGPRFL